MKDRLPFVNIIVVNLNGEKYLAPCFTSLYNMNYPKSKFGIIMVDNGSIDRSIDSVKQNFSAVQIIKNNVNNYCRANNLGIEASKGKYVAFLNNDVEVDKNWLLELISVISQDKKIGGIGSKVLFMDGRIESAGHQELPNFYWVDRGSTAKDCGQYDEREEALSLSGCAVLYRKDALIEAGCFDEDFNMYMEDVDIAIRLRRKKWRLVYAPKSFVRHIHHGTAQETLSMFYTERNRLLFIAKYYPEELPGAILGKGYFTAQKDPQAQGAIYSIMTDIMLKIIRHHRRKDVAGILSGLFDKLKYISDLEKSELKNKAEELTDSIEVSRQIMAEKEKYINNLIVEVKKRDEAIEVKDTYIDSLNSEIKKREDILKIKDDYLHALDLELTKRAEELKIKNGQLGFAEEATKISADNIGICTIISKNYLAYARVLAKSFLLQNQGRVFILLADKIDGYFDPAKEEFEVIELDAIKDRIPDFNKFSFQYGITELNTAVKPFFLEYLFEKYSLKKLIFFDPDILITDNLSELFGLLDNFSIILIPHVTKPFPDTRKPAELHILRSGIYNLGFIALSYSDTTRKLFSWWKERLKRYCRSDVENGLFVDQKWIDFIPGFFGDVFVLRDESYNIAYWNYHERKTYIQDSKILIGNKPAKFLHFSGLDPEDLGLVSKHQDRYTLKDLSHMKPIFELYRDKLIASSYNECKKWPCVFEFFTNGVKIPYIARRIYWELSEKERAKYGNPFQVNGEYSYFRWLNENIDNKKPKITRLMLEVYHKRPDVQAVYRDIWDADREAFVRWFLVSTKREYCLDDTFLRLLDSEDKKYLWMGLKPHWVYKARDVIRLCCRRLFRNNLNIISGLRRLEIILCKKAADLAKTSRIIFPSQGTIVDTKDGVNVIGYINAEHGVGEAARSSIKCLKAAGLAVALHNITPTYIRQNDATFPLRNSSKKNPFAINLIHINADMIPIVCAQEGERYFKGKYNICFWVWELSEFPNEWLKSFEYCDEIWVPSTFVLNAVSKKSTKPVVCIPYAVEVNQFVNLRRSYFGFQEDEFILLFIFDFLSYFERKNPLATIQAFKKAFLPSEKVRLVIKCCNSSFNPKAMSAMREAARGHNIDIFDRYFYKNEINTLISLCDSYISLHRCEGFGLSLAEAMYQGKPVIATGYSGNMDFMHENNSFLVKYKLIYNPQDTGPYKKNTVWAEPDIENAAMYMRYLFGDRKACEIFAEKASQDIRDTLSIARVAEAMKNRLLIIDRWVN